MRASRHWRPTRGELTPAFDPEVADYTLTVPPGTSQVGLDLDPHTPSGLVKVDGILVDDNVARVVRLDADGDTTVQVQSFAQDHTTSTGYTVRVVEGDGPAPVATVQPTITGVPQVGRKLQAGLGTWDVAGADLSVQWLVGGSPVAGATGASYQLRKGDTGKRVSVRVTAVADSREPGTADSAATDPVRRGSSKVAVTASRTVVANGRSVAVVARVTATGLVPTGRVSVYDNGRLVARPLLVNGVARLALRPRTIGRHLVVVKYAGASWLAPSRDWTTVRVRR